MIASLPEYVAEGLDFKIVDADRETAKLGGEKLNTYGVGDMTAADLSGVDTTDIVKTVTGLNSVAAAKGVRFLYVPDKQQVYLYLVMEADDATQYFTAYYSVDNNKATLDYYFNQYASGGIRLKDNLQGYTVVGNSMVSLTDAADNDRIQTTPDGDNLVRLLSSVGNSTDELLSMIENSAQTYENLRRNLLETDAGTAETVFENLIRRDSSGGLDSVVGLTDYLDSYAPTSGKVTFTAGDGLKAVLVDGSEQSGDKYTVADPDLRLVIAIGDVEVTRDFQGLIIASGTITIADNVTCKKDGEGVYDVLLAKSEIEGDSNVPANVLYNGSGMIRNGYEDVDVDEYGNLHINYSEIVRYENWIKK